MIKHNMVGTKREVFEQKLLAKFGHLKIFEPDRDAGVVERFKDGSFGFSSAAFALYSNGANPRGKSDLAPCGLLFHDGKTAFSVGYYRKEGEPDDSDGYMMIVAPKGENATRIAGEFARTILADAEIPCKGAYVRFLRENNLRELGTLGFGKVDEKSAWDSRAPLEDETYTHSSVKLPDLIGFDTDKPIIKKPDIRLQKNRFEGFLARNSLSYSWRMMLPQDYKVAEAIIGAHFQLLEREGKRIGSIAEDYFGLTRKIVGLQGVDARMGYINDVPVSIFISEIISREKDETNAAGLYCTITLRDSALIFQKLGIDSNELVDNLPRLIKLGADAKVKRQMGVTAIAQFFQIECLAELAKNRVHTAKLGGSETKDHDKAKIELGAEPDTTVWAFRGREING